MVAWGEGSVAGRGRYESPPCLPDLSKRSKPPVSSGRHEEASGTESLHCGSSEGTGRWVVAHFPPLFVSSYGDAGNIQGELSGRP